MGKSPKDAGMEALRASRRTLLNPKGQPNFNVNFYALNAKGGNAPALRCKAAKSLRRVHRERQATGADRGAPRRAAADELALGKWVIALLRSSSSEPP